MKKSIAVFALCMITVTYAAVQITLSVPNKFSSLVLESFAVLAGEKIDIRVDSDNFQGTLTYSYAPKDPNETQKQFAKKVIKEHIRAMVRLVESAKEYERYRTEVSAIEPPDVNIPDGIIE